MVYIQTMTRSRKKHPWTAITYAESEKTDKRIAARKLRRKNRELIRRGITEFQFQKQEVSEVYSFDKDGKQKIDLDEDPELMRK